MTHRSPVWLVGALGFGVFFAGFDQTFVVTILPEMMRDLGIPVSQLGRAAWIVNGYLLGYTVAMPLMGRLADAFGHGRLYVLAIGIYVVGSVIAATAPTLAVLTAGRIVQAIGGGAVVPIAMAILADALPPGRRVLSVGIVAALDDASSLLGPLWAALLVDPLGWRGLFWLGIPLQLPWLIAVLLLARGLGGRDRGPIDWLGGLLLAVAIGCLTVALTGDVGGGRTVLSLAFGVVALLAGAGFVRRQLRAPSPLIHLGLLKVRAAGAALALYFIDGAATITALVCIPLMTNAVWNGSALDGGLNLMKMMLWMPVGGVLGGLLARRFGYRVTAALSFALYSTAFLLMWTWPSPPSEPLLWGTLFALGLGIGLNDAPLLGSVLDLARRGERATAAALTQVVQTTGMIVGMALLATQGLSRFDERAARLFEEQGLEAGDAQYQALMRQTFDEVFLVATLVTLASLALTLLLARRRATAMRWTALAGIAEGEDVAG